LNHEKKDYDKQAKKILEGVDRIAWGVTACLCFPGSAKAVMHYLGEDITDDYAMGISGGAFSMYWGVPWSPANSDLLIIGEEPVRRTFDALGYTHILIPKWNQEDPTQMKELFRKTIVDSINREHPVIAKGVVGPPECCVITGYDKHGDVLHGWSYYQGVSAYYQGNTECYFTKDKWYENCYGLIVIGQKKPKPPLRQTLQNTLEWAIRLARTPEFLLFPEGNPERFTSGLAAYDAMAEALLRDEDFPAGNLDVLTSRCVPISNDGIPLTSEKRKSATRFLNDIANKGFPGADQLRKAAKAYEQETQILDRTATMAPYTYAPEEERLKLADPKRRRQISRLVLQAKLHEETAVRHLETALEELVKN